MAIEGGCYCGAVRFRADGDAMFQGQCHCRECQYATGGNPNVVIAMPESGFSFTKGAPKGFTRTDIENAVTREFCADCGTQLLTRTPNLPGARLIKVGVLDDQSVFSPQMAIFLIDKQAYHHVPDGLPSFERGPG